ncbi:MAG: hypothetical protein KDA37_03200 [Planctomycetales bacterium]|nr:hypothetical protein [Planctomycetales bacterium]
MEAATPRLDPSNFDELPMAHSTSPRPRVLLSALACGLVMLAGAAWAQDDNGATIARQPSKLAQLAIDSPRSAPADYLRDILVLVDLGEEEFAQPIFDALTTIDLADEQRAALVRQFGTARVHRLARVEAFGEKAREFVSSCLEAVGKQSRSTDEIAALVQQVKTGSDRARRSAIEALQSAGEDAVTACLADMASSDDESHRNHLREALVRLAPLSTPVVAAALDAPAPEARAQAAWALGQIGDRKSLPRLAALATSEEANAAPGRAARWAVKKLTGQEPTPDGASRLLEAEIKNTLAGAPLREPNQEGRIAYWTWNAAERRPTASLLSVEQAGEVYAARLTADLWRLNQGSPQKATQALVLRLQAEWLLRQLSANSEGLPGPRVEETTNDALNSALALADQENYVGAQIALCKTLGERRVADVLYTVGGSRSPLANALRSPHPAARFAALEAILTINPPAPFPGSSSVANALVSFASSEGRRGAVVAMPRNEWAANTVGLLAAEGIEGRATNMGNEAVRLARELPDAQYLLLDLAILRPGARETLFQVRRQRQTSLLPVALLAPEGRLAQAKQIAREHDRVIAVYRPHTESAMSDIVKRLEELAPVGLPDAEQRAKQASQALAWARRLLAEGPSFYDVQAHSDQLLAAATSAPEPGESIASLLELGTPASQLELAQLASHSVLPIAARDEAAAAFQESVKRHGLLLTTTQIVAQYERYNASETEDKETQRVLGALLDSIEANRTTQP